MTGLELDVAARETAECSHSANDDLGDRIGLEDDGDGRGCELPGEAATCRADLTGDWA